MKTTMYLHNSKESNMSLADELGLSEHVIDNFKYALYEVALEVEIDENTGDVKILTCDGKALAE